MFLDTSAVIEHFVGSAKGERVADTLRGEPCVVSILTMAEVKTWCLRSGRDYGTFAERMDRMASVVGLTRAICESGAEVAHEARKTRRGFGLMDGLILASARSLGQRLMTADAHFRGMDSVEML
ncbi:MAG: PIN domain-containing protein [Euryarchaeota archaeon]|nr:PIN domain-containing protein [Euryarchaeota archaeon]